MPYKSFDPARAQPTMSGGAIALVSEKIIAKSKALAAHIMEAAESDVEFTDGRFTVAGTDRGLDIHEVAKAALRLEKLPVGMEPGLYETATYRARIGNFPNGCHVCEVEIDPHPPEPDAWAAAHGAPAPGKKSPGRARPGAQRRASFGWGMRVAHGCLRILSEARPRAASMEEKHA
jgi:hypothetical protein